jgi:hypothetical protein
MFSGSKLLHIDRIVAVCRSQLNEQCNTGKAIPETPASLK